MAVTLHTEIGIEVGGHLVRAHVLHGLVELLETVGDGALELDGHYHLGQFGPGLCLIVFW